MAAILTIPFVDRDRVVIGGQSRGGILSVAYAGQHPEQVGGVFTRGARYPGEILWLYGESDPFYSLAHSLRSFAAFQAAGGTGTFLEFDPPPGTTGHRIVEHPALWTAAVEAYLMRRGLAGPPLPRHP